MFGIKIQGRLGNQMFQYAFAVAQQKRLDTSFYLHTIYRFRLGKYFTLPTRNYYFRHLQRLYFYVYNLFRLSEVTQNQAVSPAETLPLFNHDNILMNGFFQSESFFANVKNDVKHQFTVKEKFKISIKDFTHNDKENVVIHIRRGDYLTWGNKELGYDLALPEEYYFTALKQLDLKDKNIILVGDDPLFAKATFKLPGAFYSEGQSEIFDFQLLTQADYLILSNSTFAWWGAYLNPTVKRVYSPLYWLGFKSGHEWPADITLPSWETVRW